MLAKSLHVRAVQPPGQRQNLDRLLLPLGRQPPLLSLHRAVEREASLGTVVQHGHQRHKRLDAGHQGGDVRIVSRKDR
eukprot:scaffold7033_cov257-Pinguiococcus_pyrenoidosus.AAC.18